MKMKPLFTLVFALLTAAQSLTAQTQTPLLQLQYEADDLFRKFAYAKAIPLYEKMLVEDGSSVHAFQRLAESHLLLRDFEQAIPYFERFIENEETTPDHYFNYGMALKSIGKEKEALYWLKRYKNLNKSDNRLREFLKEGNLASIVFNSRERYKVKSTHFNSPFNDFGGITYNGRIYFSSSRPVSQKKNTDTYEWDDQPWLDIFYVKDEDIDLSPRRKKKSNFPVKSIGGDINSEYHESSIAFSTDYKDDPVIYFTRNNHFQNKTGFHKIKYEEEIRDKDEKVVEKQNNLKIFKAEKVDGQWTVTKNLELNADHYSTGHPSVDSNRTRLYFVSDKPGGYGGTDIYYCDIHPRGGLGKPVNAGPVVNTAGNETFPFVNSEGKLFFSSDGHVGYGQLDVFATIIDEGGEIVDIINLGKPVNSEKDDFAFFASEDGAKGFVSSNRKGGKGGDDIYRFTYTPPLDLEGYIYDAVNDQPLDEVNVQLIDNNGDIVGETTTDNKGHYLLFVDRDMDYTLSLTRKTHPNKKVALNTFNLDRLQKKMVKDAYMEPKLDVKVLAGLDKIYFDFNKSNIRPDAARELDKVVDLMLNVYPYMTIRLEAHTDPVGTHEYNDRLSNARAKSTYDYLIRKGVPKKRILSYKGFGKRNPVNDCKTRTDCPAKVLELNRRTEFPIENILSPSSKKPVVLNENE